MKYLPLYWTLNIIIRLLVNWPKFIEKLRTHIKSQTLNNLFVSSQDWRKATYTVTGTLLSSFLSLNTCISLLEEEFLSYTFVCCSISWASWASTDSSLEQHFDDKQPSHNLDADECRFSAKSPTVLNAVETKLRPIITKITLYKTTPMPLVESVPSPGIISPKPIVVNVTNHTYNPCANVHSSALTLTPAMTNNKKMINKVIVIKHFSSEFFISFLLKTFFSNFDNKKWIRCERFSPIVLNRNTVSGIPNSA